MVAVPNVVRAQTAGPVLWQIGQVDHDDKEFALAPNQWNHYSDDGFYIVGQSKAESDWDYVQPGPDDDWAGSQSHTASIEFALTHVETQGNCLLTLALVDSHHAAPPQLQISVNGQSWTRDTIHGAGDDSINGQPSHGKASTVSIEFPASVLAAGLNSVKITTLKGSWMIYDAVTLTAPTGDTLGTAPSVFTVSSAEWLHDVLKRQGSALEQVLRLKTFNSGPPKAVELHVSGEAARPLTIPTGRDTLELSFPESHAAAQTQVQLFAQGQPLGEALAADRRPCRHYTIYCLEHSHMDIGYAYLQDKALALHQQYLETGLKLNAADANLPPDDRFRWNIESLYEVDDWLKHATPAQTAEFRTAVKSGNLGLSALYCNELTGLCRPEELAALFACA
jgi:alpha-mannosidase